MELESEIKMETLLPAPQNQKGLLHYNRHEQLHDSKFNNPEKRDKFLDTCIFYNLKHEEKVDPNRPINSGETESAI